MSYGTRHTQLSLCRTCVTPVWSTSWQGHPQDRWSRDSWLSHPRQTVLIWVCSGMDSTFWLCPLAVHTSFCSFSSSSSSFVFIFFILSLHHCSIFSFCSDLIFLSFFHTRLIVFLLFVGVHPLPPADQCDICNLPVYNLCGCVIVFCMRFQAFAAV